MNLTQIEAPGHEGVYRIEDLESGLLGLIAIHSTQLGPAAGGVRMRPYDSFDAALEDALRLSQGMTLKNAAAGLPLGGGKAVIVGDPVRDKTPGLLQSFGLAVAQLDGRYWTAEDMGMTPADMAEIARETDCVAGLEQGSHASGDPSPITARGIFNAIRAVARHQFGSDDLSGRTVSVQGLGNVGWHLCRFLREQGARLVVTDIDATRASRAEAEFGARAVASDTIFDVDADIFAPCAIGGILDADRIDRLRVKAVAGGANNQLATPEDGHRLHQRGILYAPDFVANGGGIINVATEILRIDAREDWVAQKLEALDRTMDRILHAAKTRDVSPHYVAEAIVADVLRPDAA
ncbi:Glu/Leu/Phe/Val family dehydrogenase [Ruegeria hyattellae]|uniref:Glu/Leu/Phe/Val family dehydrogenase n=1 Tax=Ruegeria hyattellae TaxID=3233337 RepID=UPI00355AE8D4